MWKINQRTLLLPILLFCYIPTFIFLIGWVKMVYAIPSCILLFFLLLFFYTDKRKERCCTELSIEVSWKVVCTISLALLAMCLCCGYGGFVCQASDWIKHNAILQDLYTHDWPVSYDVNGKPALLTYYHAFYLFPALLGKLFKSAKVAELSFGLIGYIGLWLMTFSLLLLTESDRWYKQIMIVIVFLFFSGMLFPLQKISHLITGLSFCNNWHAYPIGNHLLQYRSVFVMLRWTGPQCFIPWLCIILLFHYKDDISSYSTMILPSLLSGTWAFLGIVIIALYYAVFSSIIQKKNIISLFSWKNILPAIIPGCIFLLYLMSNIVIKGNGSNNHEIGINEYYGLDYFWLMMFVLFIYGSITIIVWNNNKKDILFYSIPLSLCAIPFFSIGSEVDFIMGVSIPAIIMLLIYSGRFLFSNNQLILKALLLICLLFGAKYPFAELKSVIQSNSWHLTNDYKTQTMELCFIPETDINILWENYISSDLENNFYYQNFSKKLKK